MNAIPSIPKIDAHTHLFYDRGFLPSLLERWSMKVVIVNVTGEGLFDEPMDQRWAAMQEMKEQYPERVALCTTFDPSGVTDSGFASRVIDSLKQDVHGGASLVKVWKDIGLAVRDEDGRYIQIDDPRFQPVWDFLASNDVPLLAHIGEPRAAWQPLDESSPHYQFYSENPNYHMHSRFGIPDWDDVIEARDRWLDENEGLTVVGAHLGSMAHDVELVAELLDRYDNFYVDTAERFGDLVTQPSNAVRKFFCDYSDRILYGTDVIVDVPARRQTSRERAQEREAYEERLFDHWQYLCGDDPITVQDALVDPVTVDALNLPSEVLQAVYHDNASSLYGFSG